MSKHIRAEKSQEKTPPDHSLAARLWLFLNSTFGIFLMSTVFISLFSWGYNQWSSSRVQLAEKERTWKRLQVEVSNRIRFIERMTYRFPSREYSVIRSAIYGYDPQGNVNPSWIRHYSPVFPEYKERSLSSLIWELASVDAGQRQRQIDDLRNNAYQIESCFDRLEYSEVKRKDRKEPDEFYDLPDGEGKKCREQAVQPLRILETTGYMN